MDLILLALLPGLREAPIYASSAPGFAAQIPDLQTPTTPSLPVAQQVPETWQGDGRELVGKVTSER